MSYTVSVEELDFIPAEQREFAARLLAGPTKAATHAQVNDGDFDVPDPKDEIVAEVNNAIIGR